MRAGKQVQLMESEIRQLCTVSREIFLQQPNLLELEAPIKICGVFSWSNSFTFFNKTIFFLFFSFFESWTVSDFCSVFSLLFYGVGILGDWGLDLCFEHWLQRHIYGLLLVLAGWFLKYWVLIGWDWQRRVYEFEKKLWCSGCLYVICHMAWNSWIGFLSAVQTFNLLSMLIDGILMFLLCVML